MDNKTGYRLYAKELRKKLDLISLSQKCCDAIRQDKHYKDSNNIMLYYPTTYEIDLRDLFKDKKNFFLPKVTDRNILVCPVSGKLEKSELNIMEPCTEPVSPELLDMVIVPALMADSEGYRLGYGGGFYDRFLPFCKNAFKIVIVPKELFVEILPHEHFDVKVDKVLYM